VLMLETDRLVIRDHVSRDLEALYALLSDGKVMIKLGFTKEREFQGEVRHSGESAVRLEYGLYRAVPGIAKSSAGL
jgi:RimJ/RimL family protein N-acetyltransferase